MITTRISESKGLADDKVPLMYIGLGDHFTQQAYGHKLNAHNKKEETDKKQGPVAQIANMGDFQYDQVQCDTAARQSGKRPEKSEYMKRSFGVAA